MHDDDEAPTRVHGGSAAHLSNDDGPTSYDASADLKAVIAHANAAEASDTPATMVLPESPFAPPGATSGPVPEAPAHPGWAAGGAPPGLAAPNAAPAPVNKAPSRFVKRLLLSALFTFLVGALGLAAFAITMSLSRG